MKKEIKKNQKYVTATFVLAILLAVSLTVQVNDKITGKSTSSGDYGATVWLKSMEEINSEIYVDGELYREVPQMGRERLTLEPGAHEIKVIDEKGRIFEETISLQRMDSITIYITHPLKS